MIENEMAVIVYAVLVLGQVRAPTYPEKIGFLAASLPFCAIAWQGWQGGASLAAVMLGSFAWGLGYAVALQEKRRGGA